MKEAQENNSDEANDDPEVLQEPEDKDDDGDAEMQDSDHDTKPRDKEDMSKRNDEVDQQNRVANQGDLEMKDGSEIEPEEGHPRGKFLAR